MALNLISTPEKTINGILSNVDGARSQLPYTFKREDFLIESALDSGAGKVRIYFPSSYGDLGDAFKVDDNVYIYFSRDYETGNYTVLEIGAFGTNYNIVIDLDFTVGADLTNGSFINNLTQKKNYKVGVEIRNKDNNGDLINLEFKYSPEPDGRLFIDVGLLLTELHEENLESSIQYILRYQELYDGFVGGFVDTGKIQSIYGAKQLLDLGGSNMWEYLLRKQFGVGTWGVVYVGQYDTSGLIEVEFTEMQPFNIGDVVHVSTPKHNFTATVETWHAGQYGNFAFRFTYAWDGVGENEGGAVFGEGEGLPAKLLTVFENPLYWKGFYRSINFLIDSNAGSRFLFTDDRVYVNQREYDINKTYISLLGSTAYQNLPVSIKTIPVSEPVSSSTKYIAPEIKDSSSIDVVFPTSLFYEIKEPCKNPIYLGWVNSKGGLEEHMFEYDQQVQREVEVGLISESAINEDIETVKRTKKRNPNKWQQQMILGADNLTKDQLVGLMELKQSDYLVVYLNKECTKYVYVIVSNDYSTSYQTDDGSFEFQVQIQFPDNFDFFNSVEY